MNCSPGDLARIVGVHPLLAITDRIVRLQHAPPIYIGSNAYWRLETALTLIPTADFIDARGMHVAAGQIARTDKVADLYLRPIRNPGDDEVDETLEPGYVKHADEVPHG